MRRIGLLIAAGLVVVANGMALLGVARNRASVLQRIELTERELPLAFEDKEDTGVDLRIEVGPQTDHDRVFTDKKLAELGLDPRLPRAVFVACEYDGPAWEHFLAGRHKGSGENGRWIEGESHLVIVDAALSPDALRARYGKDPKHVIFRAAVAPNRRVSVLPGGVHVPLPLANSLHGIAPRDLSKDWTPRYTVRIAIGRNYEPWVEAVTLTSTK